MNRIFLVIILISLLMISACTARQPPETTAISSTTTAASRTLFGFFPSPPEVTEKSVMETYQRIGRHGDVALLQQNIPWTDFVSGIDGESTAITDIKNQHIVAGQNGLDIIFVVDPLNGLNRSEFAWLPEGWQASFADPQVRAAFTNYTMRIVREFKPGYLGLASEINTYADTHPDDFPYYMSLYNTVYDMVKTEAPATKVFVTFQWDEINNLIPGITQGEPYDINWEMIEQFEPKLDIWAISSYPFAVGLAGKDIPVDYYSPLLTRTGKQVAVAEGGFTSETVRLGSGTPQDQVDYLNAIHSQLGGERLAFWIYLIIADINIESYTEILSQNGRDMDAEILGIFANVGLCEIDGTPKPALELWDSFHNQK